MTGAGNIRYSIGQFTAVILMREAKKDLSKRKSSALPKAMFEKDSSAFGLLRNKNETTNQPEGTQLARGETLYKTNTL